MVGIFTDIPNIQSRVISTEDRSCHEIKRSENILCGGHQII